MSQFKIEKLSYPTEFQFSEISKFVDNHPNTNFFQSINYFKAAQKSPNLKPYFFVISKENLIVGSVLVVNQSQINFPLFNKLSARNIISGGPLIENNDNEILLAFLDFYKKNKPFAIYTQIRNFNDISTGKTIFEEQKFNFEEHLNILVDLKKSEEELWKDVHTKRRNEIRRASKEGTIFENSTSEIELNNAYLILQEVYNRAKLPLPKMTHFKALFDNNSLKLFIAKNDNKTIGCMLCLAHKGILFDYYAGAYSAHYSKYPNDLIPWEVFLWAKNNHFTQFDFGGAGKPNVEYGVREYKKKFGGELVNFGRFEYAHFPFLFSILSRLFKFIQKIKK